MPEIHVTATAPVDAPPAAVYAVLADYHGGHAQILPAPYFEDLTVVEGGQGAGTKIRFQMVTFGQRRTFHAVVDEPAPGRVLTETDLDTGTVTRFEVAPAAGGTQTVVTISTRWQKPGLAGWIDRLLAPPMLRKIYAAELENLARVAQAASAP